MTSQNICSTQDPIVLIEGENMLFAFSDGRLKATGPAWKECQRPEKPCPRSGRDPMPEMYSPNSQKCRHCSYSGTAHMRDQEQALAVAKLIYPQAVLVP